MAKWMLNLWSKCNVCNFGCHDAREWASCSQFRSHRLQKNKSSTISIYICAELMYASSSLLVLRTVHMAPRSMISVTTILLFFLLGLLSPAPAACKFTLWHLSDGQSDSNTVILYYNSEVWIELNWSINPVVCVSVCSRFPYGQSLLYKIQ